MTKKMHDRAYPDHPLVGAGAVIVRGDELVLIRRGREPHKDEWSIPGGMVELGETLRHAAEREALEETGLIVEAGEVVEVFESITPAPGGEIQFHYVVADFLCRWKSGELRAGGDASVARWVKGNEVSQLQLPETTLRVIQKAFNSAPK